MTTPSGSISMSDVLSELLYTAGTTMDLNNSTVRALAQQTSGSVSFSNLRSRTNRTLVSYTSAGSYSWTCPPGISSVDYMVVGGGGGGGAGGVQGGGGGVAGAVNVGTYPVSGGSNYGITVGGGGSVSSNGTNSTGFGSTAVGGGSGGTVGFNGATGGSGGGATIRPPCWPDGFHA